MSVLDLLQAEEEKARQQKTAVLEENRVKLAKAQEAARAEAAQRIEAARRQAETLIAEAQKRLDEKRNQMLQEASLRDEQEAQTAREHLSQAAARIVERVEQL